MKSNIVLALFVLLSASTALGQEAPKSNVIPLGEHSYWLTVRDGVLVLSTKTASSDEVVHHPVAFEIPRNGRVTEMRLEPWMTRSLCGVVEVSVTDEYQYSCITLFAADNDGASALFHTTDENHAILSVNGTFRGDSILALLGILERKEFGNRVVSSGIVFLHDCPQPPSRGSISKFKAETEVDPALFELLKGEK